MESQVSKELERRSLSVTAHAGLVAVLSAGAGAIGIAALQQANSMMHSVPALPGHEWNVRLETPTDLMFANSTHLIWVDDVTIGMWNAAEAFHDLSSMLDHVHGVTQDTRNDPDSKLSLRLTGVFMQPDDADDESADAHVNAQEARFSAQILLQQPSKHGATSHRLDVLLQLLPLEVGDRYDDKNEKLAARARAIKALADQIHAHFATLRNLKHAPPAGAS